jgi:hypothetical protein
METTTVPIETEHFFFFDSRSPVTPRALATSLLGLEGALLQARPVISCLLGTHYVKELQVYVTKIEIGSYKDNFLVRLIFGRGRAAEKKIEELRKALKVDQMDAKKVVGLVLAAGIAWVAYQYLVPGPPPGGNQTNIQIHDDRITIENSFNNIASGTGLTGDELRAVLDQLLTKPKKNELKRNVSRLLHPTGDRNEGSIQIDGDANLSIPEAAAAAIPPNAESDQEIDPIENFEDVQMLLRAADLDNDDRGWWGIFDEVSESRVPVHILPTVDRSKITLGKYMQVDVTVTYRVDRNGNRRPRHYLMSKVY